MEPCTTHTYALKSVRWHNYTDNIMLLQGNQPWINNPRVVILNDAYGEISPDAFSFVEDCYDRKITGTREQPAVFQKIRCFWDNMQFCIETEQMGTAQISSWIECDIYRIQTTKQQKQCRPNGLPR